MIKFFRHIRKSLLMETGKTGKYFPFVLREACAGECPAVRESVFSRHAMISDVEIFGDGLKRQTAGCSSRTFSRSIR